MNKRQRKKQISRNKRELKKTMRRFFRSMAKPDVIRKVGEVASGVIRAQLAKPSLAPYIFGTYEVTPMLYPPYKRWAGEDNVVHWTGDTWERPMGSPDDKICVTVRLCDFKHVSPDRFVEPDETVTCVRCHALQHERMNP